MRRFSVKRWGPLALLVLGAASVELGSESLVLNSFYPSPLGIYASLTTTGNTALARDGGLVTVGPPGAAPAANVTLQVNGGLSMVDGNQAAGLVMVSDPNGNASWAEPPPGSGLRVFFRGGPPSFTVPPRVHRILVEVWGAGGGGGGGTKMTAPNIASGGAGGGAGGYAKGIFNVNPGDIFPVSIGKGGGAGAAVWSPPANCPNTGPSMGGAGQASSFGSGAAMLSAGGGAGGCGLFTLGGVHNVGHGGVGGFGTSSGALGFFSTQGGNGGPGPYNYDDNTYSDSGGGGSAGGGGGSGGAAGGVGGSLPGGGGAGGAVYNDATGPYPGGGGAEGRVIVWW